MLSAQAQGLASAKSNTESSSAAAESDAPSWLFPLGELDERLPRWVHIGGEYRERLEGPTGIGFTATNDFYLLQRLRINLAIHPKEWLNFYGEVQDSRIFFNHHIANANPYEDSWTLWQAYTQIGSSTSGWVDALAGRQVLTFGDERVIGPSDWLNVGRTFDVARVDLHHPGYEVAIFGSSSCIARAAARIYITRFREITCTGSTQASIASFPVPPSSLTSSGALRPRILTFLKRSAAATSMK